MIFPGWWDYAQLLKYFMLSTFLQYKFLESKKKKFYLGEKNCYLPKSQANILMPSKVVQLSLRYADILLSEFSAITENISSIIKALASWPFP